MTNGTPRKKVGKFIKKGDLINKVLDIQEYTFEGLNDIVSLYTDNAENTIIHSYLHQSQEINNSIRVPQEIKTNFAPPEKRRIIQPRDFTDDWERIRHRQRRRQGRYDEEEELELEMEYLRTKNAHKGGLSKEATTQANSQAAAIDPNTDINSDESEKATESAPLIDHPTPFKIQRETLETVGKMVTDAAGDEMKNVSSALDMMTSESVINQDQEESEMAEPPIITNPEVIGKGSESTTFKAFESFKDYRISPRRPLNSDENTLVEEAKAKGYEEGFKIGEEKAALQTKQKTVELSTKLIDLMVDLEGLKKNILINSQENFVILCQAMMESLLKREFELNKKSLATVIERAINEAIPEDKFRILVNPETLDDLRTVLSSELKSKLEGDDRIAVGNFRVESNLTIVDGNLVEMVGDLLKQANLELFEAHHKAG